MAKQKTEKQDGGEIDEKSVRSETEGKDIREPEEKMIETQETVNEAESIDDELSKMEKALEKAQAELAESKEQMMRAYADAQNAKRRAQIDTEKAHKFALEKFVESLLPVVDSLERGMVADSSDEVASAMKEGMELTLKLFIDTLKRFNVEQISPEGEPFDPALHQAMSQMENGDVESGTVISVFQKGYALNGRLVRPAMVIVAK